MGESAITAGVSDTPPVIAQGWFCGSRLESALMASRKVCAPALPKDELPSGSQT
jgi:hypothetical protein